MAECMLNFESLRLDVVEAVRSGKRNDVLHAPAVRRMQLAQQQRLVQDQEARHGELERVLETADRERAYRGSQAAEDDETDAGGNLPQVESNWLLCCFRHSCKEQRCILVCIYPGLWAREDCKAVAPLAHHTLLKPAHA